MILTAKRRSVSCTVERMAICLLCIFACFVFCEDAVAEETETTASRLLRVEGAWPTRHQWSSIQKMVYGKGLCLIEMLSPPNVAGFAAFYEFSVDAPGRYGLWLVGAPPSGEIWVSPVSITVNGRKLSLTPKRLGPHPRSADRVGDEKIQWTRVGEVELPAGKNDILMHVMERRKWVKKEYYFWLDEIIFAPLDWSPPKSLDPKLPPAVNRPAPKQKTTFTFRVDAGKPGASFPPFDFGLSQGGGWSHLPKGFIEEILPAIRTLKPKTFRQCHLNPEWDKEDQAYDFAENDRLVDEIRAMGAEIIACITIGYGPFRKSPASRIDDLDAWEDCCYEIAKHYNIDRKLGIRYWEVLNEPSGTKWYSNPDHPYIEIFIRAQNGIKRADPEALVGGPVTSDPTTIEGFLQRCLAQGAKPDFVSYHIYSLCGDQFVDLAERMRARARQITGNPGLPLLVTEWGPQASSAGFREMKTSHAAAYNASVLTAMTRRPGCPDIANLFMLKDIDYDYNKDGVQDMQWGLFTFDNQPRPSFFGAQLFFNMHGSVVPFEGDRNPDALDGIAVIDAERLHVYLWHLEREGSERKTITLDVTDLPFPAGRWRRAVIDPYCTNPYQLRHTNPTENRLFWTDWRAAQSKDGALPLTFDMVPPGVTRVDIERR